MSWKCTKCANVNDDGVDICPECGSSPEESKNGNNTPTEQTETDTDDNSAERTLRQSAGWLLALYVVPAVIICILSFITEGLHMGLIKLLCSILGLIPVMGIWAAMNVFANISVTLKEIKNKMK